LRNLRLALGASLNPLFQTQPNQTVQEITNYSPNLRIREREITERGLPGPGSDRMKCARRSPASARRRRRNPARSTPSTPTRHPLEKERTHIGVSKLPCSGKRGGNPSGLTHPRTRGWVVSGEAADGEEGAAILVHVARGGAALSLSPLPLPLRCLPTYAPRSARDPHMGGWPGRADGARSHGRITGAKVAGRHGLHELGALLLSPVALASV
jgi:hypothetical protein